MAEVAESHDGGAQEYEEDDEGVQKISSPEETTEKVEYFNPFAVVKKVDEIENNKNTAPAAKNLFGALSDIQSLRGRTKRRNRGFPCPG